VLENRRSSDLYGLHRNEGREPDRRLDKLKVRISAKILDEFAPLLLGINYSIYDLVHETAAQTVLLALNLEGMCVLAGRCIERSIR